MYGTRPTDLDYLQANATIAALDYFIRALTLVDDPTGVADAQILHATRAADRLRATWAIQSEAAIDAAHEAATVALDKLVDAHTSYDPVTGTEWPAVPVAYDSRADEYRTRGA